MKHGNWFKGNLSNFKGLLLSNSPANQLWETHRKEELVMQLWVALYTHHMQRKWAGSMMNDN